MLRVVPVVADVLMPMGVDKGAVHVAVRYFA
jgi:hypothetical protein